MVVSKIRYVPADRILMIINDTTIVGRTRLQKYGFLLSRQYEGELSRISRMTNELKFYNDWKPYWYGPFSDDLRADLTEYEKEMVETEMITDSYAEVIRYSLTIKGRVRWRAMLEQFGDEMHSIHDKIRELQSIRLERLLECVYNAYPEFTKRSTIKERFS